MRLHVLGNTRAYTAPYTRGTSYVLEADGTFVVVDAGPGTLGRIGDVLGGRSPDAVVVTHFHVDHVAELAYLAKAMAPATPLAGPRGTAKQLDLLAQAFDFKGGHFDLPGPLHEEPDAGPLAVGPLALSFAATVHRSPSVAVRFDHTDGGSLVLASDTGPCDAIRDLARGADLLVVHTLIPRVAPDTDHHRFHLTGETAGQLARDADVGRLLLSHVSDETVEDELLEAVAEAFPGDAAVAVSGGTYSI